MEINTAAVFVPLILYSVVVCLYTVFRHEFNPKTFHHLFAFVSGCMDIDEINLMIIQEKVTAAVKSKLFTSI